MTPAPSVDTLPIGPQTHVLALTGAGVSAESGIPTFRGAGGLWKSHSAQDLATPEAFERDPALVWRFYSSRRERAENVQPNPGHLALAALEAKLGERFLLATQNVDGLHRIAGSQRLVELHGNLFTTRCSGCARPPFPDHARHAEAPPHCEGCGGLLRPHIVWFGEALDPLELSKITAFLRQGRADLVFVAVGTSGAVSPAAGLVDAAAGFGAQTWLVNADPADNGGRFRHFVQGKSGVILPRLLSVESEVQAALAAKDRSSPGGP
jgi:NAD-dependent deacetylase